MVFSPTFKYPEKIAFLGIFLLTFLVWGQAVPKYTLDVYWDDASESLEVQQKIQFQNNSQFPLDSLYLNDWANAYSSTQSPLAIRLAEEFDRSFYLSQKSKRGYTTIKELKINNKETPWQRKKEKLDLLSLELETPLGPEESLEIDLRYSVKLPEGKFTGYGKLKKETYFIENFFITLSDLQNGKWQTISNLDLEDIPNGKSDFTLHLNFPQDFEVVSNLIELSKKNEGVRNHYTYQGNAHSELIFHFGKNIDYQSYKTGENTIITDFKNDNLNKEATLYSLSKIQNFVNEFLGPSRHRIKLLSTHKYNKRPFLGLTLLPSSFLAYPSQFEFEVKTLSTFLRTRLKESFPIPNRDDFWFTEGLHFYLLKSYVEKYYPNKKVLGNVLKLPLIKNIVKLYNLSDLRFNDGFKEYVAFIHRRNLQQPGFLSKGALIKFNERMGQPSQNALLMDYLQQTQDFDVKAFATNAIQSNWTGKRLKDAFIAAQRPEYQNQISALLQGRSSIDLKVKNVKSKKDSIAFTVEEKSERILPFNIVFSKNDSTQYQATFFPTQKSTRLQFPKGEADYLNVYYPSMPDFNPRNNVKRINALKPLKFTLIKDLEDPKKNQLFYNPRINFNIYDGISFGVRLNNKTIKSRPLTVVAQPIYSSFEKTLIGSFSASYIKYKENSRNHFTQFGLAANSYHYDEGLRYTLFLPYINFYLRNNALRSNRRELITLSGYHVNREQNINSLTSPNYNIVSLSYLFSKNEAIDYFTFKGGLQASDLFGKFEVTTEFRKLLRSGRQFSFRAYGGKFLWHTTESRFFDFSLNRPNDYLFQYNYLGRSEVTGLYSQQFIMAEGGFKTDIPQPHADDYIFATNFSMGLWKYFEAYGDWAVIKRRNQAAMGYFDTGLRLNLLPDYLELYFPIYNSLGWSFEDGNYSSKIRFVITLEPRALTGLLSRKWF